MSDKEATLLWWYVLEFERFNFIFGQNTASLFCWFDKKLTVAHGFIAPPPGEDNKDDKKARIGAGHLHRLGRGVVVTKLNLKWMGRWW